MRGTHLIRGAIIGALTAGIALGAAAATGDKLGATAATGDNKNTTADPQAPARAPAPAAADTPVTACAGPPPERTGKPVWSGGGLGPVMAMVALMETVPYTTTSPGAWWCSEKEFTAENLTMSVWRSTSTSVASGRTSVQRITVRDHPVTVYVVFSVLASAPLNKQRNAPRLTWRAHVLYGQYKGQPAVYRSFDNEPDPETLTPLIAKIVSGNLKPDAYLDGNTIRFGHR